MNRRNFIKYGAALTALAFFYPEKILGGAKVMTAENLKWWKKTIVYQIYPKSFQDRRNATFGLSEKIGRRGNLVDADLSFANG